MIRRIQTFGACALLAGAMVVWGQVEEKAPSFGTLENGVYHHNATGVQFSVPSDWAIVSQVVASGGAQDVLFRDTVTNVIATVWFKARTVNSADIPALMDRRLDSKVIQRNNFQGYKYRPDSIQHITIGGQPAVTAIADYVRGGQPRVEFLTWIDGEKSRVVFSARMPASELANFQPRFEELTQSAVVP
jgi:hypothetical protein